MPAIDTRTGVLQHDKKRATNGYTLFTPIGLFTTYLIDMSGYVVHQWEVPNELGHYAYLLENGNLLASVRTEEGPMGLPAKGGHLIEYDWDGNIVWEHIDHFQHHDFAARKMVTPFISHGSCWTRRQVQKCPAVFQAGSMKTAFMET